MGGVLQKLRRHKLRGRSGAKEDVPGRKNFQKL